MEDLRGEPQGADFVSPSRQSCPDQKPKAFRPPCDGALTLPKKAFSFQKGYGRTLGFSCSTPEPVTG